MSLIDPYPIITPPGLRPVGQGPFWTPGDTVTWTFRRFDFDRDLAEVARPMRVIADGPEGAVLWLAGGTPTGETRIVGWEEANPHDVPLTARFRPLAEAPTRIKVEGTWRGRGVLKIVPPQVPFSVWVLLKDADGADDADGTDGAEAGDMRVEWYVNLEATHRRSDDALFTSDHILDITFPVPSLPLHAEDGRLDATGAVFKDVDELAAAANYGAWPVEWSQRIRDNGSHLLDHLGDYSWAFDSAWEEVARDLADEAGDAHDLAREVSDADAPTGSGVTSKAKLGAASVLEKSFDQEHAERPNGCYDRHHR
ncbi:DUF402 domain-containing protein [Brevibacterium spongiae]|uniref:DUF402 domain-containing protein n=1 Tax=Brevibacterium spongiae TaxID=2909672 RepID=A0ABY5SNM4_9MICO|nr:DUF402 domain-containing protein [Brevibacterium spongiae]UVI35735.1 DUF402 domain-containing protein [Brevibacterium spongiae]